MCFFGKRRDKMHLSMGRRTHAHCCSRQQFWQCLLPPLPHARPQRLPALVGILPRESKTESQHVRLRLCRHSRNGPGPTHPHPHRIENGDSHFEFPDVQSVVTGNSSTGQTGWAVCRLSTRLTREGVARLSVRLAGQRHTRNFMFAAAWVRLKQRNWPPPPPYVGVIKAPNTLPTRPGIRILKLGLQTSSSGPLCSTWSQ